MKKLPLLIAAAALALSAGPALAKKQLVIVVKGLQQVRPGMPVTPQLVAMGEPRRGGNTLVAQN